MLVALIIRGAPVIKNKIKKSLLEAYPGADITSVKCGADPLTMNEFKESYGYNWYSDYTWLEDKLYMFEVNAGDDAAPVLGLATEEGNVLFDEYAFIYYRDDLQSYVMDIAFISNDFYKHLTIAANLV